MGIYSVTINKLFLDIKHYIMFAPAYSVSKPETYVFVIDFLE